MMLSRVSSSGGPSAWMGAEPVHPLLGSLRKKKRTFLFLWHPLNSPNPFDQF